MRRPAREHRVFFGALDVRTLLGVHRMMRAPPASRKLFIEGGFRDWTAIDAVASIAHELAGTEDGSPAEAIAMTAGV